MSFDLGQCAEHKDFHRYCGFIGVPDLAAWAKSKRARWRYEESYKAERDPHVRGDGRWYVELLGRNGIVYPYNAQLGTAFVKGVTREKLLALDPRIKVAQQGNRECSVRFPWELLERVLEVVGQRYKRSYTPEQRQKMAERLAKWQYHRTTERGISPGSTQEGGNG